MKNDFFLWQNWWSSWGVCVLMGSKEADVNLVNPNVTLQLWSVLQSMDIHIPELPGPEMGGFDLMIFEWWKGNWTAKGSRNSILGRVNYIHRPCDGINTVSTEMGLPREQGKGCPGSKEVSPQCSGLDALYGSRWTGHGIFAGIQVDDGIRTLMMETEGGERIWQQWGRWALPALRWIRDVVG